MSGKAIFSTMRSRVNKQLREGQTVYCHRCNTAIDVDDDWDIDHKVPIAVDPDLEFDPTNLAPSHARCNRQHGARLGVKVKRGTWKGSAHRTPGNQRRLAEASANLGGTSGPIPRDWPRTLSDKPREPGAFDRPPLQFSEPHPDAVGTLIDEWCGDIERLIGRKLRFWQWLVLARGLEVDSAGRLVWFRLVCTTPRQQGKSVNVDALSQIRCEKASYFEEEQTALFVSKDVRLARALQSRHWNHYAQRKDEGFNIRRSFGAESITWPDGSSWQIVSQTGVYGWTASLAMLDEAWSADPAVITSALGPTMAERAQPQLWLMSTANLNCTDLMPSMIKDPAVCVMYWGAHPDEDPRDPGVWEAASAFWTPQRKTLIDFDKHKPDLVTEWLNRWPKRDGEDEDGGVDWIEAADWEAACSAVNVPHAATAPVLAGVEVSLDGLTFSASRMWRHPGTGRLIFTGRTGFHSLGQALNYLGKGWDYMLAGLSIKKQLPPDYQVVGVGAAETRVATGLLARVVTDRMLTVDPASPVVEQLDFAAIDIRETGPYLNSSRSGGDVSLLKLLMWSTLIFHTEDSVVNQGSAAIW